jgi:hypothetical protein
MDYNLQSYVTPRPPLVGLVSVACCARSVHWLHVSLTSVVRTLAVTSRFSLLGPQYTESIDVFYIKITDVAAMVSEKWQRLSSGDSRSAVFAIRRGRMMWLKLYRPCDEIGGNWELCPGAIRYETSTMGSVIYSGSNTLRLIRVALQK